MKKIIFAFVISLLLCSSIGYADTVQTNLKINQGTVIKSATTGFLGINDTWYAGILYGGSKYKDAVNSAGIPINLMRMAGADAHDFKWKDSLGPLKERANGSSLGLVEWIKYNQELNPDVELTFTLNIIEDSIDDHKDLVRFLLLEPDDPKATDANGFNWAQYRVDLGITDPVNIKLFELGNEVYYDYIEGCAQKREVSSSEATAGANAYISDCNQIISAMRSVKSDITFSAVSFSYTNATSGSAQAWNSLVVNQLYQSCAYFTHHQYFFDYNFYQLSTQLKGRLLDYIDALPVANSQKPHIYVSEYGYWMEKSRDNLRDGTSLFGTLTMAKYLNFLINTPHVDLANVHVTNEGISSDDNWNSGWDLFRLYDDGKIYTTVPTEMLKIFNSALENNTTNNVISAKLSGSNNYWGNYLNYPNNANTAVGLLNVSAFKTNDGGINLLLVNSSATVEHNLSITYQNNPTSYKLAEKQILTSDNLADNNLPGTENLVYVKKYTESGTSAFTQYTVPAKSIVLLKLIPINSSRTENKINFVGDHKITNGNVYVGKNFGIQMSVNENEAASTVSDMDLYIIKDTVSPEAFVAAPNSYLDEIVYVGSSEFKRNYLYYDIVMPDNLANGRFYAIIGDPQTNYYNTASFSYTRTAKTISGIEVNTISKSNDNTSYLLNFTADANFENEPVVVRIYKNNDGDFIEQSVVYADKFNSQYKINKEFEISDASIAGDYVIELIWEDVGTTQTATSVFEFEKVDEHISICEYPTNENENAVTLDNIASSDKIFVTLKNNKPNAVEAFVVVAEYDSNGIMTAAKFNRKNLAASSDATTVEVSLDGIGPVEQGGYIKLLVWKEDNIMPYANVTYVK